MKITDSMIKKSCSATIYKRGLEYFKEGRVHLRKREDNLITAVVDGEELYNVQVRLSEKGAVDIDKTTGVYKYTPKTSKSDCVKCEVDSFVERVFDNSAYNLMASLLREGKLSAKEKKDIINILNDIEG